MDAPHLEPPPPVPWESLHLMRTTRGYSFGDLATRTGLSRGHLHDLETGRRARPHLDTVQRIADALGVSTAAISHPSAVTR